MSAKAMEHANKAALDGGRHRKLNPTEMDDDAFYVWFARRLLIVLQEFRNLRSRSRYGISPEDTIKLKASIQKIAETDEFDDAGSTGSRPSRDPFATARTPPSVKRSSPASSVNSSRRASPAPSCTTRSPQMQTPTSAASSGRKYPRRLCEKLSDEDAQTHGSQNLQIVPTDQNAPESEESNEGEA